jgi:hypothetical protein
MHKLVHTLSTGFVEIFFISNSSAGHNHKESPSRPVFSQGAIGESRKQEMLYYLFPEKQNILSWDRYYSLVKLFFYDRF